MRPKGFVMIVDGIVSGLAHGAVGAWDEVIYLMVAAIFIAIMGVAWVRSRNTTYDFDDEVAPDAEPAEDEETTSDRFRLD
jgi:hypothetical protein